MKIHPPKQEQCLTVATMPRETTPRTFSKLSRIVIFSLAILTLGFYLHPKVSAHYLYSQQQQQQQQQQYNTFINGPSSIVGPATAQMIAQLAPELQQTQQQLQQQQGSPLMQPQATHLEQQQEPMGASGGGFRELATRDSPIFRFQGQALNSTTVRLVWSLGVNSHVDYFDIEYGPIPDSTHVFSLNKLNGTARDYTFHQLQPDTHYQFQLFSYQGDRAYKPQLVAVRTPPANFANFAPKDLVNREIMPLGVKAEAKSNSSIQLSWTEPERPTQFKNSHRVNIIRYYINPSLATQNDSGAASGGSPTTAGQVPPPTVPSSGSSPQYHYLNVTNARESRLIVQKLRPATEYAFAIKTAYYTPDMKKIFTQSGFSMDTLAKTFDLEPSPPRNFSIQAMPPTKEDLLAGKTTGTIEFNWLPPESPNGQLKGYVILYSQEPNAPDDKWHWINVTEPNITNWSAGNLKPGWHYYFKIRAINQRGQSNDSEIRQYISPAPLPTDKMLNMPIPANNVLLLIIICMVAILFLLFLVVSKLACRTRGRKPRKGSLNNNSSGQNNHKTNMSNGPLSMPGLDTSGQGAKLSGFNQVGSSSTVVGRVGTLARRRGDNSSSLAKPDFWAIDQSQEVKSNCSEKNQLAGGGDLNMAMVSIQRDSPQFATTQLAPALPDYRFAAGQSPVDQHLLQQLQQQQQQQQGHYHPGQFVGSLAYDQMDSATASALMTLSKRQQQQLQKYQIQFATTGAPTSMASTMGNPTQQAPSPHQQPPPPPPLNIEQQQQQQQQSLYGSHQPPSALGNTRSLRLHRPTLYDPVSGAFVQATEGGPPNYSSHNQQMHPLMGGQHSMVGPQFLNSANGSNTLQFHHPHQTSTLLSRRSTNTLRSFQTSGANSQTTYGQFLGAQANGMIGGGQVNASNGGQFVPPPLPTASSIVMTAGNGQAGLTNGPATGQQQLSQSHQAVINQLNNSTYPSLPLKHVSTVRPQIMSSLEDQIEMELAEKEQQQQEQQQTIKQ